MSTESEACVDCPRCPVHSETGSCICAPGSHGEPGSLLGIRGLFRRPPEPAPQERIVAAAIRQDGVVFTGPHHHQIIRYMVPMLGIETVSGEQGFVTSLGRYVGRQEGARIAFLAGQIEGSLETLFSELLWSVPDWCLHIPRPETPHPPCPGFEQGPGNQCQRWLYPKGADPDLIAVRCLRLREGHEEARPEELHPIDLLQALKDALAKRQAAPSVEETPTLPPPAQLAAPVPPHGYGCASKRVGGACDCVSFPAPTLPLIETRPLLPLGHSYIHGCEDHPDDEDCNRFHCTYSYGVKWCGRSPSAHAAPEVKR